MEQIKKKIIWWVKYISRFFEINSNWFFFYFFYYWIKCILWLQKKCANICATYCFEGLRLGSPYFNFLCPKFRPKNFYYDYSLNGHKNNSSKHDLSLTLYYFFIFISPHWVWVHFLSNIFWFRHLHTIYTRIYIFNINLLDGLILCLDRIGWLPLKWKVQMPCFCDILKMIPESGRIFNFIGNKIYFFTLKLTADYTEHDLFLIRHISSLKFNSTGFIDFPNAYRKTFARLFFPFLSSRNNSYNFAVRRTKFKFA